MRSMNSLPAGNPVYDDDFFDYISMGSMRSAKIVVPLILRHYPAASLADIGCGRGAWLVEWHRAGIADFLGIDGDYIDKDKLLVPADRFLPQDLTKRFDIGRRFDLVVSLEVGEHIHPDATEVFVDNLCAHSDAILFSAAVPGQGGKFHANEQNYEFWKRRFGARGYRLFDFVRPGLISRHDVEPWYRFNSLFFARGDAVDRLSREAQAAEIGLKVPVPNFGPMLWRLRNAIIRRLPPSISDQLVELKHQLVRWRH